MSDKQHTGSVSESESPAIPAPTPKVSRPMRNKDWWPNQLDLSVLHTHSHLSCPLEQEFDYAEQFSGSLQFFCKNRTRTVNRDRLSSDNA